MADWKVKAAFKELHAPLSKDERRILEEEIVAHGGARDPISTWRSFIADGHNRHEICDRLKLPFTTVDLTERFHSQEEVEEWIIRNQLGRRNLTAERFTYLIGKLYNSEKQSPNGDRSAAEPVVKSTTGQKTSERIAEETGISEKTVRKAGKVAEAVDAMPASLKEAVLSGEVKATDKAKLAFAEAPKDKQTEAHRAVRTGQAESLDVALGIKKPKPDKPPKEENDESAPRGTTKATKFNDKALESSYGKLSRGMEARAKAMGGKGPHYEKTKKHLIDFLESWKQWKLAGPGAK